MNGSSGYDIRDKKNMMETKENQHREREGGGGRA